MFSALFAPCASIIRGFQCAKNVQKCAAPFDAGKNWNLTISTISEFRASFTLCSFIFFMIQNFIIHIGFPAGFGTNRTAVITHNLRDRLLFACISLQISRCHIAATLKGYIGYVNQFQGFSFPHS